MPQFTIEAEGEAREVYTGYAENEEDLRSKFAKGELGEPSVSEITGSEIKSIREEPED